MGESEFFGNLMELLCQNLYDALYPHCSNIFDSIFVTLNTRMLDSSALLSQDLESWNAGVFSIVKSAAENVCIPIAGAIFVFVFTWEITKMVEDNNLMQNVSPEKIAVILGKLVVCLYVTINSFNIVMFIYSIGHWAVGKLSGTTPTFGAGVSLNDVVPAVPDEYNLTIVLQLLGILSALAVAWVFCQACGVIIYFQVINWFLDLGIYASAAAIPFSTFINRDWGQTGMNYGKMVFAVGLRGFFMFLFIAIYGGIITNLPGSSFMDVLFMLLGAGGVLVGLIWKSGNIADSILNAH